MKEVGGTVPALKMCYVDGVHKMARELKNARRKSEVDRCQLAGLHGKIGGLNVKVQLLANVLKKAAWLQT